MEKLCYRGRSPGQGKMRDYWWAASDSSSEDPEPWYAAKMYSRYWMHYNQAMYWLYKHKRAYRKAIETLYHPQWYPGLLSNIRYSDWGGSDLSRVDHCASFYGANTRPRHPYVPRQQILKDHSATQQDSESDDESEEEGIECDVSNMEITEELRQYFAQTERHREELRKQQELEAEQNVYVEADHDLHAASGRSVQPPTERPGERRVAEMKKLYGEDAAKIQAMETAMQLNFDRNCDKKRPKYWPVIPMKL
ncbi:gem-associated protein 8 [Microcaecilia unicolor]|uniref:Gem-associated protein 8 n=1 Tax=Microcaecilia unicolor TaxID=1415580 RepID=A0A6P7XQR1_9AMPH|nr:gem-associated protein 8 [Microcaecilia unicolor]